MTMRMRAHAVAIGLLLAFGLMTSAASAAPTLFSVMRGGDCAWWGCFTMKAEVVVHQSDPSVAPRVVVKAKNLRYFNNTPLSVRLNGRHIGYLVVQNRKATGTFTLNAPMSASDRMTVRKGSKVVMRQTEIWHNH